MFEIKKEANAADLTLVLSGRLDTTTAPQLEEVVENSLDNVTNLVFDFERIEYISSAGLRVLLAAQKRMNKQGGMLIKNVAEEVMEIFDLTGFSDILNIQ